MPEPRGDDDSAPARPMPATRLEPWRLDPSCILVNGCSCRHARFAASWPRRRRNAWRRRARISRRTRTRTCSSSAPRAPRPTSWRWRWRASAARSSACRALSFAELAMKLALPVLAERLRQPGRRARRRGDGDARRLRRARAPASSRTSRRWPTCPGFPAPSRARCRELQLAGVTPRDAGRRVDAVGPTWRRCSTRVDDRGATCRRGEPCRRCWPRPPRACGRSPTRCGARHVLLLDVAIATTAERALLAALAARRRRPRWRRCPTGDAATPRGACAACGAEVDERAAARQTATPTPTASRTALDRLQTWLFAADAAAGRRARRLGAACSRRPAKGAKPSRSRAACCAEAARGVPVRRDGGAAARAADLSRPARARASRAPACRRGSSAARGVPIRPAARSSRCSPAPTRACRRAASPSTCRSARCRSAQLSRGLSRRHVHGSTRCHGRRCCRPSLPRRSCRPPIAPRIRAARRSARADRARRRPRRRRHAARAVALGGAAGRGLRHRRPRPLAAPPARPARTSTTAAVRELADEDHDSPRLRALERDREQLAHLETFAVPIVAELDDLAPAAHLGRVARRLLGAACRACCASRRACCACSPRWRRSAASAR